jgi:hypothetical protein
MHHLKYRPGKIVAAELLAQQGHGKDQILREVFSDLETWLDWMFLAMNM